MGKKQIQEIPNVMLSVREAAIAITVSTKMIRKLICSGRIKSINLGMRLTRITLDELLKLAEESGYQVIIPSNEPAAKPKPETGKADKTAKCRKTPAHEKAPDGVTHDTHYTMAEVLSKFGIKYGRLYEIRNRYLLNLYQETTCANGVDATRRQKEHIAFFHLVTTQNFANAVVVHHRLILLWRNRLIQTAIQRSVFV